MRFSSIPLAALVAAAFPLFASGQSLPSVQAGADNAGKLPSVLPAQAVAQPLWQDHRGHAVTLVSGGQPASVAAPVPNGAVLAPREAKVNTGVQLNVSRSLYARAGVSQREWLGAVACQPTQPGISNSACLDNLGQTSAATGEVGAGFANNAVRLDLSVGQSHASGTTAPPLRASADLPRILPSDGGAAISAPLLFPDSTSTNINARGQVRVLPGTRLDLGASQGRVHFLPGAGAAIADDLNQTTLSLGIEHGPVSGTIVGRMLEPALPGSPTDGVQRWAGVDLGVSVRLPWQGELSFGAQNVWSSGKQPLLNPQDLGAEQTRVPYVQYHQDL